MLSVAGLFASTAVVAQEQLPAPAPAQALERVQITGSSVPRVDTEGALPVQILTRDQIRKIGATSITDLLQKLPTTQGGTPESASVGGGGNGFAGVSIHNIGEERTLVLLNGRRLAIFAGQEITGANAGFDINTLPIAGIDRIEILTDGASAIYGADAIAGVVNFITRRNSQEGEISVGASKPQDGGAEEKRVSLTKGFGDLDADGFNVLITLSADKRKGLDGRDRSFAKTGVIPFSYNGKRFRSTELSPSSAPANALDDDGNLFSPYAAANGSCAPGTIECQYDFVSQLEIFPERERKTFMSSMGKTLGPDHMVFADVLWSRTDSTGKIAPLNTTIPIDAGTSLHDQYLLPNGVTGDSLAFWRGTDLGQRSDDNRSEFKNFVLGLQGLIAGWDYKTAISQSESTYRQKIQGYPGGLALQRLIGAGPGQINPFLEQGQQSQAALSALQAQNFNGVWNQGESKLTTVDLTGTRQIMELAGGPMAIGTGVSFYKEKFSANPSLFAQGRLADIPNGTLCDPAAVYPDALACDQRAGDDGTIVPFSADRKAWGAFVELVSPITKEWELISALRYDHYDDFGSTTNAKGSFRWTPSRSLLVRGSVGTGFKAPSVPQVKATPQPFGLTGGFYDQTPELEQVAARLGATLQPDGVQYDQVAGGNQNLKPEKSKQASIGFVFEPVVGASVGADLWYVAIRDAIGNLTEEAVFGNPLAFPSAWTTQRDNVSGIDYLAFNVQNENLGKLFSTGIDLTLLGRQQTEFGLITSQLLATYMLRQDQQLVPGGPYYSAIGNNNPELGVVTFRWKGRWLNSIKTGDWLNTFAMNFKSGYRDAEYEFAELLDANGAPTGTFETVQLKVDSFVTFDWQTQWQTTQQLSLTAGVLNVFNKDPPLSLATSGLGKGQNFGYDDRYYDPRGRTFYLDARFSF
jgi:iron complex outermembrane receptor protein